MSKKGKLRHIEIRPAANGYTVHAHHDMPPQSKGEAPMDIGGHSEPMVFQKKKHVLDHVSSLLDDNDGDEAPAVPPTHPVRKLQRNRY